MVINARAMEGITVRFATILLTVLALGSIAAAQPQEGLEDAGLKIVEAKVLSKDTDAGTDLLVYLLLKNVGDKEVTVLTKNLQVVLYDYTNKAPEVSLELSGSATFKDSLIVPSYYEFAPVALKPGEIAQIRLPYQSRRKLDQVVLVYDMLNDWSKRFKAWSGRVRTEKLQPLPVKQLPNFDR